MPKVQYINLGTKDYKETWDYQEELYAKVLENKKNNPNDDFGGYFIVVEHPHVYTLGKSGEANNLLINADFLKQIDATFYKINRGGDITYHGPGQIVGYPIIDLEKFGIGIREYIHRMEEAIIQIVGDYSMEASRLETATGVWLDAQNKKARKICAIGVRVSRQITMHGFAMNVNTNLDYFSYINPCGFQDKGVTTFEKELLAKQNIEQVKEKVKEKFAKIYQFEYL